MSNCSGLTDEALETLANSITASRAQEVPMAQPQDADAAQLGNLSISDAFGNAIAGNTSRFYIQVYACQGTYGLGCKAILPRWLKCGLRTAPQRGLALIRFTRGYLPIFMCESKIF